MCLTARQASALKRSMYPAPRLSSPPSLTSINAGWAGKVQSPRRPTDSPQQYLSTWSFACSWTASVSAGGEEGGDSRSSGLDVTGSGRSGESHEPHTPHEQSLLPSCLPHSGSLSPSVSGKVQVNGWSRGSGVQLRLLHVRSPPPSECPPSHHMTVGRRQAVKWGREEWRSPCDVEVQFLQLV